MQRTIYFWPLLALIACSGGENPQEGLTEPSTEEAWRALSSTDQLNRASMALRGVRPSPEELAAVQADSAALEGIVDEYLESPEFLETIKDMHAELYLTKIDTSFQLPVLGLMQAKGYSQADMHFDPTSAPMEFVADVVANNQPYSDILTADYTLANETVADIFGMPYDPEGPEWQRTQWTDGRPQSGLLSDSAMWMRHVSNAANFHRGRANFVSKTWLCEDIGGRDVLVEGGVDIADEFAVAHAVQTQTTCVGCHNVLDPLAAYFWGYKEQLKRGAISTAHDQDCEWDWDKGEPPRESYRLEHWCYPLRFYDVNDEPLWDYWQLNPPGYFGQPGTDMRDLGTKIVEDPRFATCTAKTFYSYFAQTPRDSVPPELTARLQETLITSEFSVKDLARAIVLDPTFTAADMTEAEPTGFAAGLQTIRPEQWSRFLFDITGFRWLANQDRDDCAMGSNDCWEDLDLSTTDLYGFRSIQGGVDGYTVTHPTHTATPTKLLAMRKSAQEAAGWVVEADFRVPAEKRTLLTDVTPLEDAREPITAQLEALHIRILGEFPSETDLLPAVDLWYAIYDRTGDTKDAWRTTITAMLLDVRVVYY